MRIPGKKTDDFTIQYDESSQDEWFYWWEHDDGTSSDGGFTCKRKCRKDAVAYQRKARAEVF